MHYARRLLPLLALALGLGLIRLTVPSVAAPHELDQVVEQAEDAGLIPLPKSCVGGLPPGEGDPACCLFGYVFVDGQPVAGARVTVTTAGGAVEDWTGEGPDSSLPYFRLSLSDPPLSAVAGDTITISVVYAGSSRTLQHTVLNGAQQVDLVLPMRPRLDFAADRQLWQQSPPGGVLGPRGIAVDANGTIYAVDSRNARVQVFNHLFRAVDSWGVLGDRVGELGGTVNGIALSPRGTLYVVDSTNSRVQELSVTGDPIRSWGGRGSGNGQFNGPVGIAIDGDGVVYVSDRHRIQKFSPSGVFLRSWGQGGSQNGQFSVPAGIAVDAQGNVYVADSGNDRVQKFSANGQFLTNWGGSGTGPGQFDQPTDVAIDPTGRVFVTDTQNDRVQLFTAGGQWIDSWGVEGMEPGRLDSPRALTIDGEGNVYVADTANNRLQKFTPNGDLLQAWAAGRPSNGKLSVVGELAYDSAGNLYAIDINEDRVVVFDPQGRPVRSWGGYGFGPGQFWSPYGIAIDSQDHVYISDRANHRIQKFTANGSWLRSWGSEGSGAQQLNRPAGMAVDSADMLYVADTQNNRIVKFTPDGQVVDRFGSAGTAPGQFDRPHDVAVDQDGAIYVADTDNNRIQKLAANGTPLTSWGTRGSGLGQLNMPQGVTLIPDGGLLIADSGNARIQFLDSAREWAGSWGALGAGLGNFATPYGALLSPDGELVVADSSNGRIQFFRPVGFTRPIATIVAVSERSVAQGEPITLYGMASDSDMTPQIAALEWYLDNAATPFARGSPATLATARLTPGRHTITLLARDEEGEISDPQSITVTVSEVTPQDRHWTFLLYLDGDAPNLAPYLNLNSPLGALYRLERAGSRPHVTVAALYDGPRDGDTRRYLLRPDGELIESLPPQTEVNMGDPQTLVEFARWGLAQAPADYTYLALANHANALDGIAWDTTSGRNERLTPEEIRQALTEITAGGGAPIDVLHLDGCLMGLIEPAYQARGLARYLVVSENLGWSAFAYERYRAAAGPQISPADLAAAIVDRYAGIVGAGGYPYTISALDLSGLDQVSTTIDQLAGALISYALAAPEHSAQLNQIRIAAQKLDSGANFRLSAEDEYLDLDHWAELVGSRIDDSRVETAASALRASLDRLILRNATASGSLSRLTGDPDDRYDLPAARGLGIYYPPRASVKTYQIYVRGGFNFVDDIGWDEFLAIGLAPLPFGDDPAVPRPVEPLPLPTPQNPTTTPTATRTTMPTATRTATTTPTASPSPTREPDPAPVPDLFLPILQR